MAEAAAETSRVSPHRPTEAPSGASAVPASAKTTKEGDLLKLRLVGTATPVDKARWYRRHVAIRGDFLLYFRDSTSEQVAGWVRLVQVSQVERMPPGYCPPGARSGRDFVFRITIVQRKLYFCASSDEEVRDAALPWCSSPPNVIVAGERLVRGDSTSKRCDPRALGTSNTWPLSGSRSPLAADPRTPCLGAAESERRQASEQSFSAEVLGPSSCGGHS
jgi:hypothetical protein